MFRLGDIMKNTDSRFLSEKQKEQQIRKKRFNKKLWIALGLYILSILSYIVYKNLSPALADANFSDLTVQGIEILCGFIGSGSAIAGVMVFAKSLHNPLTEEEAEELAEKDRIEKCGK